MLLVFLLRLSSLTMNKFTAQYVEELINKLLIALADATVDKKLLIELWWKPIPKYDEVYWVAPEGIVWSLFRNRPVNSVWDTCWYRYVRLSKKWVEKKHPLHQIVCLAFHGKPPRIHNQVNHKDLIKTNNHYMNLEWSTGAKNAQHRVANWWGIPRKRKPLANSVL